MPPIRVKTRSQSKKSQRGSDSEEEYNYSTSPEAPLTPLNDEIHGAPADHSESQDSPSPSPPSSPSSGGSDRPQRRSRSAGSPYKKQSSKNKHLDDVVDCEEGYFDELEAGTITNVLEAMAAKYNIFDRARYGLDALPDPPGGLDKRPDIRIHELCAFAIVGSATKSLTHQQILAEIRRRYPYFIPRKVRVINTKTGKEKPKPVDWTGTVRHTHSFYAMFQNTPRPKNLPGQGGFWSVIECPKEKYKRPRKRGSTSGKSAEDRKTATTVVEHTKSQKVTKKKQSTKTRQPVNARQAAKTRQAVKARQPPKPKAKQPPKPKAKQPPKPKWSPTAKSPEPAPLSSLPLPPSLHTPEEAEEEKQESARRRPAIDTLLQERKVAAFGLDGGYVDKFAKSPLKHEGHADAFLPALGSSGRFSHDPVACWSALTTTSSSPDRNDQLSSSPVPIPPWMQRGTISNPDDGIPPYRHNSPSGFQTPLFLRTPSPDWSPSSVLLPRLQSTPPFFKNSTQTSSLGATGVQLPPLRGSDSQSQVVPGSAAAPINVDEADEPFSGPTCHYGPSSSRGSSPRSPLESLAELVAHRPRLPSPADLGLLESRPNTLTGHSSSRHLPQRTVSSSLARGSAPYSLDHRRMHQSTSSRQIPARVPYGQAQTYERFELPAMSSSAPGYDRQQPAFEGSIHYRGRPSADREVSHCAPSNWGQADPTLLPVSRQYPRYEVPVPRSPVSPGSPTSSDRSSVVSYSSSELRSTCGWDRDLPIRPPTPRDGLVLQNIGGLPTAVRVPTVRREDDFPVWRN